MINLRHYHPRGGIGFRPSIFSEGRPGILATTALIPLHAGKGRSIAAALGRSTDYVKNPDKTDGGEWVTAYECDPISVDQEFAFSKSQYAAITGRDSGEHDVIAYHLRQSFKPGETDPATANRIGYELAKKLTKGHYAFLVCTHTDKGHIHSHIIFNSTRLDCTKKFRNFWGSSFAIRKISDQLCLENGLSIIENPQPSKGKDYGSWLGDEKHQTQRDKLRMMIDTALYECKSHDAFLAAMKGLGVEVKTGKHLAFKIPEGKRFIRLDSLDEDYSETALLERISGKRVVAPKQKTTTSMPASTKPNLLIDIQAKIQHGYGPGFERYAKVQNLKEAAKTLIFLQERGLTDYNLLTEKSATATKRFNNTSDRIKEIEARLGEISSLQKHIGSYSKTRDAYKQYRDSGWKKKFYTAHESDIITHKAAKKHFDSLGLKKLPSIQSLKQEYAALAAEKNKLYQDYRPARAEMIGLLNAKQNVEQILGMTPQKQKSHEKSGQEL